MTELLFNSMMQKINSEFFTLKAQVNFLQKYKEKVSQEVLIETFIRKQEQIKQSLKLQGADLSERFCQLLKMMKGKNFNFLSLISKTEQNLNDYYGLSKNNQANPDSMQIQTKKTKKIKKNQKCTKVVKNDSKDKNNNQNISSPQSCPVEQIFEQSLQEYKVLVD